MQCNSFLDVLHKALIQRRGGATRFRQRDALGKHPALWQRRTDYRHRAMILLDDNLNALLDSVQHAMQVPGYLGFGHAHLPHRFDHSASSVYGLRDSLDGPEACPWSLDICREAALVAHALVRAVSALLPTQASVAPPGQTGGLSYRSAVTGIVNATVFTTPLRWNWIHTR